MFTSGQGYPPSQVVSLEDSTLNSVGLDNFQEHFAHLFRTVCDLFFWNHCSDSKYSFFFRADLFFFYKQKLFSMKFVE